MSVLPPDLPRLRTLVTYLGGELDLAEAALATARNARPSPRPDGRRRRRPRGRPSAGSEAAGFRPGTHRGLLGHRQPLHPFTDWESMTDPLCECVADRVSLGSLSQFALNDQKMPTSSADTAIRPRSIM